MFDSQKIDQYFIPEQTHPESAHKKHPSRQKIMRFIKMALPAFAALLIGLLIIIPTLKKDMNDVAADLITPKKGELEKFHMEKGIFYITDYKNIVNNFNADTLDETEAGSKIIKMTNPQGTLPSANGKQTTINAPIGFYDQNTKMLTLQNGVTLIYNDDLTTKTEEMFFDFNINKAYGLKPITTHSDSLDVKAQGFEYFKDKDILVYKGKTHITIQDNNQEGGF